MYRVAPVFWVVSSGNKQPDRLPPGGRGAFSAVLAALDLPCLPQGGGACPGHLHVAQKCDLSSGSPLPFGVRHADGARGTQPSALPASYVFLRSKLFTSPISLEDCLSGLWSAASAQHWSSDRLQFPLLELLRAKKDPRKG